MPPSPLDERLVVQILQRPRTLALHLNKAPSVDRRLSHRSPQSPDLQELTLTPALGLQKTQGLPGGGTESKEFGQPANSHPLDSRVSAGHPQHIRDTPQLSFRAQVLRKPSLVQQQPGGVGPRSCSSPPHTADQRGTFQTARPWERPCFSSPATSCLGIMHPLKCGCRGCWRRMRRDESGTASCVPCKPSLRALGCGPALRKLACFPALRSLSCITCDPSMKSVGSTCSFCSSDPIVTYDPRGSKASGDDDDYNIRTIWPEELAKKMTQSKVQQQSAIILDCRHLVEYTKNQLQGAMSLSWSESSGRSRAEQGQLTVFDLLSSRESKQPFQPNWPQDPSSSEPRSSKAVTPHSLHLILDSLSREDKDALHLPDGGGENNELTRPWDQEEDRCGQVAGDPQAMTPLTPDVENAELSPIVPFLYLGNERDAQDLAKMRQLNVGYVINVTTHLPLYHAQVGNVRYKRLPATDNSKQNLRQYFEEAFEFIEAHLSGKGVLIHCQAGVSRSATLVIAYLMKHTLMTMTDAYKYVKGKRPIISPNLNFMGQLLEFEMDLNKGLTPRILTPKLSGLETEV
ncbi:dual specificity protein phosphatase 10-like isoform X2 [Carcharodon carcharias]|uniref:dual specificity protein phosphatase 10-like isoform X2 n=1 Tax=Carcharodon carcharias TaxID=13397 RepID=UPI001B7E0E55|nr:dual specificity protein phosphatase 10-like isoform X2 [Carcharodon carcharias]